MKEIITFLQRRKKDVILFVDEIHTLVGAGKTSGSSDATQILKVPLARGEIVYAGTMLVFHGLLLDFVVARLHCWNASFASVSPAFGCLCCLLASAGCL